MSFILYVRRADGKLHPVPVLDDDGVIIKNSIAEFDSRAQAEAVATQLQLKPSDYRIEESHGGHA